MTEQLEVLSIVTERLELAQMSYMVTGSFAANYYAVPRMTRDIDIVVELSAADVDRLFTLFELSGSHDMNDTRPDMDEKYRQMLLSRSGEERLKMGSSMCSTARALVRASVLVRDPQASPATIRRELFLRFYGHEFDAEARQRIAARLGGGEDSSDAPRPVTEPAIGPVSAVATTNETASQNERR